jgi:hypothetical protein
MTRDLFGPRRVHLLNAKYRSTKETGNAVGDALSRANRWEVAQKGSQENAFVTLGYVGARLLYEIAI